jgi:hypothetical protein
MRHYSRCCSFIYSDKSNLFCMALIIVLSIVHENVLRIFAFSVYRVIICQKLTFVTRIHKGDYGVWNQRALKRCIPTCTTTMFCQLLNISIALYHYVRHAE